MSTEPNALRDAPDNWQFADLGVRASRVDDKTLLVRGAEGRAGRVAGAIPRQGGGTMIETKRAVISKVLMDVAFERARQDARWGEQNHPDGTGGPVMAGEADDMRARCQFLAEHGGADWRAILLEEVYEALAEDDPAKLRAELIQVAAVAACWVEAIDRRTAAAAKPPKVPCPEGFYWIGQSFATCDQCGLPAWEHAGMAEPDGDNPFGGGRGFHLRPWKPGEAEACRRKWQVVSR